MNKLIIPAIAALLVGACAQKSAYEMAVEDCEPVYCYKSIGGVACYEEPYHRDERRMVNYFGPAPIRYDRPDEPNPQKLFAPEPVDFWVKDPEPVPEPAPKGDLADRPWLLTQTSVTVQSPEQPPRPEAAPEADPSTAFQSFLDRLLRDQPAPAPVEERATAPDTI